MPQAKKMRLGSSDEWPPQNDVVVAEGPLVLFPDGKEPTPRPDAVLLSQGTKVEQALTAFDVQNLSLALSELAVLRITRDVYRAVQLKSESTEVYIIISADVERTLTSVGTNTAQSILGSARDAQSSFVATSSEAATQIRAISVEIERAYPYAGRL